MKNRRIAPLGVALALAFTATAASAEVVYTETYVSPAPYEVVRVERVAGSDVVTYPDGYVVYNTQSPRVVERYYPPRETVVIQADPVYVTAPGYPYAYADPRHPSWGHLIDYGLFNREGPNDFGR